MISQESEISNLGHKLQVRPVRAKTKLFSSNENQSSQVGDIQIQSRRNFSEGIYSGSNSCSSDTVAFSQSRQTNPATIRLAAASSAYLRTKLEVSQSVSSLDELSLEQLGQSRLYAGSQKTQSESSGNVNSSSKRPSELTESQSNSEASRGQQKGQQYLPLIYQQESFGDDEHLNNEMPSGASSNQQNNLSRQRQPSKQHRKLQFQVHQKLQRIYGQVAAGQHHSPYSGHPQQKQLPNQSIPQPKLRGLASSGLQKGHTQSRHSSNVIENATQTTFPREAYGNGSRDLNNNVTNRNFARNNPFYANDDKTCPIDEQHPGVNPDEHHFEDDFDDPDEDVDCIDDDENGNTDELDSISEEDPVGSSLQEGASSKHIEMEQRGKKLEDLHYATVTAAALLNATANAAAAFAATTEKRRLELNQQNQQRNQNQYQQDKLLQSSNKHRQTSLVDNQRLRQKSSAHPDIYQGLDEVLPIRQLSREQQMAATEHARMRQRQQPGPVSAFRYNANPTNQSSGGILPAGSGPIYADAIEPAQQMAASRVGHNPYAPLGKIAATQLPDLTYGSQIPASTRNLINHQNHLVVQQRRLQNQQQSIYNLHAQHLAYQRQQLQQHQQQYSNVPTGFRGLVKPNHLLAPPQPPARRLLVPMPQMLESGQFVEPMLRNNSSHIPQRILRQPPPAPMVSAQPLHPMPAINSQVRLPFVPQQRPTQLAMMHQANQALAKNLSPPSIKNELINRMLVNNLLAAQAAISGPGHAGDTQHYLALTGSNKGAVNMAAGSKHLPTAAAIVEGRELALINQSKDLNFKQPLITPGRPAFSLPALASSDSSVNSSAPLAWNKEIKKLTFIERVCRIDLTLFWWSLLIVSIFFMSTLIGITRYIY